MFIFLEEQKWQITWNLWIPCWWPHWRWRKRNGRCAVQPPKTAALWWFPYLHNLVEFATHASWPAHVLISEASFKGCWHYLELLLAPAQAHLWRPLDPVRWQRCLGTDRSQSQCTWPYSPRQPALRWEACLRCVQASAWWRMIELCRYVRDHSSSAAWYASIWWSEAQGMVSHPFQSKDFDSERYGHSGLGTRCLWYGQGEIPQDELLWACDSGLLQWWDCWIPTVDQEDLWH